jgi:hypothetical protein
MKAGIRHNISTHETELVDLDSGQVIENILITDVQVDKEYRYPHSTRIPTHRALVSQRITLEAEFIHNEDYSDFQVIMFDPDDDEQQPDMPIEQAVRFIRFMRK